MDESLLDQGGSATGMEEARKEGVKNMTQKEIEILSKGLAILKPYDSRPIGAPNSDARREQEYKVQVYNDLVAILNRYRPQ